MKHILFFVFPLMFQTLSAQDTLFVYGPGGPQAPMEECAQLFAKQSGIPVKVTAGPEARWIEKALKNADIIFGGAEYMLTQFSLQHKGFIDSSTRAELYKRAAGILVRPGNPKKIQSFRDLTKSGIKLLDVNGAGQLGMWEDIAGKQNLIAAIQKNLAKSFTTTADAIEEWKRNESLDAWIVFSSWHYRLPKETALIKIPPAETVYRGTPVAVTTITSQKQDALRFIRFLQTPQAHAIFIKWGWE